MGLFRPTWCVVPGCHCLGSQLGDAGRPRKKWGEGCSPTGGSLPPSDCRHLLWGSRESGSPHTGGSGVSRVAPGRHAGCVCSVLVSLVLSCLSSLARFKVTRAWPESGLSITGSPDLAQDSHKVLPTSKFTDFVHAAQTEPLMLVKPRLSVCVKTVGVSQGWSPYHLLTPEPAGGPLLFSS